MLASRRFALLGMREVGAALASRPAAGLAVGLPTPCPLGVQVGKNPKKCAAETLPSESLWEQNVGNRGPTGRRVISNLTRRGVTMDASAQDLLLVSGGAVGLRAAIVAPELNPKHEIAVVREACPASSHAVFAECSPRAGGRDVECGGL